MLSARMLMHYIEMICACLVPMKVTHKVTLTYVKLCQSKARKVTLLKQVDLVCTFILLLLTLCNCDTWVPPLSYKSKYKLCLLVNMF